MDAGEHRVMRMDRHWKETQARGDYDRHKRTYEQASVVLAEAVYVRVDLSHADVVAALEVFRLAKLHKETAWRVLQEVMFK